MNKTGQQILGMLLVMCGLIIAGSILISSLHLCLLVLLIGLKLIPAALAFYVGLQLLNHVSHANRYHDY